MYSLYFESRVNNARMGYIRMSQTAGGLISPTILGATVVDFTPKGSKLVVAQEWPSTDDVFSVETFAATGIPEYSTLEEMKEHAYETWLDTLKDATAIDDVTTYESEGERRAIAVEEDTTPSGLIIAKSLDEVERTPDTEFIRFVGTPAELEAIREIGASILGMGPVGKAPGDYA